MEYRGNETLDDVKVNFIDTHILIVFNYHRFNYKGK
jgi:hypothetical protein